MANLTTLARPYEKAAFEAAKSAHQLPLWSTALKQLSFIVNDPPMVLLLKDPRYSKKQLCELMISLLRKTVGNGSTNNTTEIENFIYLLASKKRLNLLPAISTLFEASNAKESGYAPLTVTSAFSIDDKQKQAVTEKLATQLKTKCDIVFNVDETLIGGMVVRGESWVMDGSIKGQLARLRTVLV